MLAMIGLYTPFLRVCVDEASRQKTTQETRHFEVHGADLADMPSDTLLKKAVGSSIAVVKSYFAGCDSRYRMLPAP